MYKQILDKTTKELNEYLADNFLIQIPEQIETVEDMQLVSSIIPKLINNYSYLMSVLSVAKYITREKKRAGVKQEYEDFIDKREALENHADILKIQYQALSRMITIKQEINHELNMSETIYR